MGAFGKILLVLLLVAVLGGVLFLFYGKNISFLKNAHKETFGENSEELIKEVANFDNPANKQIVSPPKEQDWCRIQQIGVPVDVESYKTDAIIGWDAIENCCLREITGYNCALQHESNVRYCYTSNVGGSIIWTAVEGYFVNVSMYKVFIQDLDKQFIENKQATCDIEKYPELLRIAINDTVIV